MYSMVTLTAFTLSYPHSFCGVLRCTCISPLGDHYRLWQPATNRRPPILLTTVAVHDHKSRLQLIRASIGLHTKLHDKKVTSCNTVSDKCPWTLAAQALTIDGGGRCLNGSTILTQASTSNAKLQRCLYVNSHTQRIFMACWHSEHCVLSFKGLHLFVWLFSLRA